MKTIRVGYSRDEVIQDHINYKRYCPNIGLKVHSTSQDYENNCSAVSMDIEVGLLNPIKINVLMRFIDSFIDARGYADIIYFDKKLVLHADQYTAENLLVALSILSGAESEYHDMLCNELDHLRELYKL